MVLVIEVVNCHGSKLSYNRPKEKAIEETMAEKQDRSSERAEKGGGTRSLVWELPEPPDDKRGGAEDVLVLQERRCVENDENRELIRWRKRGRYSSKSSSLHFSSPTPNSSPTPKI